jgi:molybdopterin/thiamine biosynthesis adenylyltransferase
VANCSETGVLGAAAGVMGSLQGLEVLKEAAGLGTGLAGKILTYKALSTDFRIARLPKDPGCALCGTAPTITDLSRHG